MRKRIKRPKKLFTIMMLCFIAFNGLFLLISGGVYYATYSDIAYREIRATKEELLDETSQKLSNYVKGIQDTALFLVTHATVQQYLSEPVDSLYDYVAHTRDLFEQFQRIVTVKEGVLSIELYTDWMDGYPPLYDSFMHTMEDARSEGWLERLSKSDGFWIASHSDASSGDSVVSYAHRIIGLRGETMGVVKINIPDKQLFGMLDKPDALPDNDKYYVIFDARGHFIASSPPPGFDARTDAADIMQQAAGTKYSVIQSEANAQSWMLLHYMSKDVLQQSSKEIRTLIIGLLSALIVLSVPLAFWVTRRLTSPIYGIVEGMRAVEKGDFNVRMNTTSIQEYLHLTTHFNRMVQRLKDLIGRLGQEHRDRREAEVQLLHAQIKPHFLYNTLDMIHWRALDYNAHDISGMVQQLSKLFRIGLSNDKWHVTVRDELMHARCYMAIQQYRHKFSIDYTEHVESELHDAVIPKIILQPFLENTVIHGFRHRHDGSVVRVGVARHEEQGRSYVVVTITDNGCGLPAGFDLRTTGGIGIRNVADRIHMYCGPQYGVQVDPVARGAGGESGGGGSGGDSSGGDGSDGGSGSSGDAYGEAGLGAGTRVTIRLPLLAGEEEAEQLTRSLAHAYDFVGG